jgi:putative hydrolase of the HAD superfamily
MIKTIALDYGNVLARPASGNWMLPKNFKDILGTRNAFQFIAGAAKLPELMKRGVEYLEGCHLLRTEEEEYGQFKEFYRILFGGCGIKKDLERICGELARHAVYGEDKVVFYEDAVSGVEALKERWRVVVISDTWPSLKRTLQNSGVLALLDGLVMSCDHGVTKSKGSRLFEAAMEECGLVPAETLFVDDSAENLAQAKALGFHAALMDREGKAAQPEYPVVRDLAQVLALAQGMGQA